MIFEIAASEVAAVFEKSIAQTIRQDFDVAKITDPKEKRLFDKITKLGDSGLDAAEFKELQEIGARMSTIYSTGKVCSDAAIANISHCPEDKRLDLDPQITNLLANSRDQDVLLHLWTAWRDATGKNMRTDYQRYVELKNKAAVKDGELRRVSARFMVKSDFFLLIYFMLDTMIDILIDFSIDLYLFLWPR